MFTGLETGLGLDVVLALQSMQNGVFDVLATVFHAMGNNLFYLLVLTLVFWSFDRRLGTHLIFALIFVASINIALKLLFQTPRPFTVSDEVRLLVGQWGYGIPSGHVMNSLVFWGYFVHYMRKRWMVWALVVYLVLMAWARMYGGVHYPQDVIAGVIFGVPTLWIFIRLTAYLPPVWDRFPMVPKVAATTLGGLLIFIFLFVDESGAPTAGTMIGVGMGIILENQWVKFKNPEDIARRAAIYVIGITGLLLIFFGLQVIFSTLAEEGSATYELLRLVRYTIVTLIAYFGITWLGVRFGLLLSDTKRVVDAKN